MPVQSVPCGDVAEGLTWTVHLLRRQPGRLPRLIVAALVVVAGGLLVFHNLLFALLSALTLGLSLSEFLFPIRYTLTPHGALARHGLVTLEMAWGDVRHAYLAADGVKLSPLARRGSALEPLRGLFLRFADNEDAVIAAVRGLRREAAHG